eukprot:4928052-Pyramimonas_sp.AAC.1
MDLEQVTKVGGHYVLVVLSGNIWPIVESLLNPLREKHLVEWRTIVIVSIYPRPSQCNEKFKAVHWLQGNPQHVSTLTKVGFNRKA